MLSLTLFALFVACSAPESAPSADPSQPPVTENEAPTPAESDDGAPEDANTEEDAQDPDQISTIPEYVEVYCDYAVTCNLYAEQDSCVTSIIDTWFLECSVASVEDLNTCAEWISKLECDDTGWIDACDDAFDCD